jgi:Na+-driven multidrug efflux pump
MKALCKTLYGDFRNLSVVVGLVAVEFILARFGHGHAAAYATPLLALGAVTWLAR